MKKFYLALAAAAISSHAAVVTSAQLQHTIDNRISDWVYLDPANEYVISDSISIPDGVKLDSKGGEAQKVVIKKDPELISGIRLMAKNAKDAVMAAEGQKIVFDSAGDVVGYEGLSGEAALSQAMSDLNELYRAQGILDALRVEIDGRNYLYEVPGFTRKCVNASGESLLCGLDKVAVGSVKFKPFYEVILAAPAPQYDAIGKYSALPVIKVKGASNVSVRNMDVRCAEGVPLYPAYDLGPVEEGKLYPDKNVDFPGFNAAGIMFEDSSAVSVATSRVSGCSIGIYGLNNSNMHIVGNDVQSNVDSSSVLDHSLKQDGYFGVSPESRFKGINGIRVHGTSDKNYVIENNVIGSESDGPEKAIHIHGTSPSGRSRTLPDGMYPSEDAAIFEISKYIDRADSSTVGRKNFKIKNNIVKKSHISGIDLEGDVLNVEITGNVVSAVKHEIYQRAANIDKQGYAVKIASERSLTNLFNKYINESTGATGYFPLQVHGFAKNVLVQANELSGSSKGVGVLHPNSLISLAYDHLAAEPGAGMASTHSCEAKPEGCSLQLSVENNILKDMENQCLYGLYVIGASFSGNTLDTCNIQDVNAPGPVHSGAYFFKGKYLDFRGNQVKVSDSDGSISAMRKSLAGTSDYYISIRFNGTPHVSSFDIGEWYMSNMTTEEFKNLFNYSIHYPRYGLVTNLQTEQPVAGFHYVSTQEMADLEFVLAQDEAPAKMIENRPADVGKPAAEDRGMSHAKRPEHAGGPKK